MVITCASHAQGPQFDPGQRQLSFVFLFLCYLRMICKWYFYFFRFRKGEAVFRSDNMSTISVLKEVLSKITAQRKMQVKFSHGV